MIDQSILLYLYLLCFDTLPLSILDETSLSSGISNSTIPPLKKAHRSYHHHPLPLKKALGAVLTDEDHTDHGLVFHSLVSSLLYYFPYQLDLL